MTVLLTGGSGFLGTALCRELLAKGERVRVFDNHSRGRASRLKEFGDNIELVEGDVRDYEQVKAATAGCTMVWHLAYINGTRFFYERPDDVLEVGIKGGLHTVEAALSCGVKRYVLASTSETYNTPTHVPTNESESLKIPDVRNPRFSYGGGKIASELLTLHLGGHRGLETVIFRPHNFVGPDMGNEHVIPEITYKMMSLSKGLEHKSITLPIQGDGTETRAFCDVRDGARGAYLSGTQGSSGEIYHVGTQHEVSIRELIFAMGEALSLEVTIENGPLREGGTPRRCPDISKLAKLGYAPKHDFKETIEHAVHWYRDQWFAQESKK